MQKTNTKPYLELFEHTWHARILSHYEAPETLHRAVHYVLEGEGKRVRALCAMLSAKALGKDPRVALSAACAVEMIHAYSLVHDDLPCMDNDDWRRGRPSAHRAFDESTALLAGDALLTDAFQVLTDGEWLPENLAVHPEQQAKQVAVLARAAGGQGMVLGQARDLWWTARSGATADNLNQVHLEKTGALLGASCALGAIAAGASREEVAAFQEFGRLIGLAFQAIDDTLDTSIHTGKSMGKDQAQQKLTYLKFHSTSDIKSLAKDLTNRAKALLPAVAAEELKEFAEGLVFRTR